MAAGAVPGMLEWMPASSGAACMPIAWVTAATPVTALRHEPGVAQALHQHYPGPAVWAGSHPAAAGLAENP